MMMKDSFFKMRHSLIIMAKYLPYATPELVILGGITVQALSFILF
jgi:hypothetical protein